MRVRWVHLGRGNSGFGPCHSLDNAIDADAVRAPDWAQIMLTVPMAATRNNGGEKHG